MNKLWLRLSIFTLGVLAVLSVVAFFLPTAQVTIYPDQQTQSFDIPVQASTDIQEINLSGLLPAQSIEFIIEGRDQITTTGSIALPAAPATGVVQFTNLSVDPVQIPAGTVVRTLSDPAIRFRTTRIASLPGENGAIIDVPVEAIQPGSNGNLGTERLVAIEGPLGINLRVSNSNPTSGGKNQRLKAVSAADQEKLFQRLVAALQQTAWEEYQASADPKDLTLQSNAELDQILEEEYSASVGEPADFLELRLRAVYRVNTVLGTDIQAFANSVLDASLLTGYTPIPETLQITHEQIQNSPQKDQTGYDFHIERRVIYQPDLNSLPRTILGLPLAEAYSVLGKNIPMTQEPRIVLFPENWPRLPYLPFRITLNIEP
jgi:hypothetical protein